jgi:Tol biopolymer transport system component
MKHRRIQTWVVLLMAAVALDLAGCGGGGGGGGGGRPGVNVTRVGGGVQGLGGGFGGSHPALSQDGRYVAFQADFTNLVAGDTNNVSDIFVYDGFSKTTARVSIPDGIAPGAQANDASDSPVITPDGRYVAFNSNATNLIANPADTNLASDVYVRDTNPLNPRTVRMSVGDGVPGTQGNNGSFIAGNAVAIDNTVNIGNVLVAFYSSATNLFPALDNNGSTHVYLRSCSTDFLTCTTVPVDNTGAQQANGGSLDPSISKNGRFVVYTSDATNLVASDTNNSADIFVFDRVTRQNVRVSVDNNGAQGNGDSTLAAISASGRYVVFTSAANNLVAGLVDNNAATDVFLHDRSVNGSGVFDTPGNIRTTRVSVGAGGAQGNGASNISILPVLSISDDGKFVVYETAATNFDPFGDANGVTDVYLYNTVANTTSRLSVSGSGAEANNFSVEVTISGDGKVAAYSSLASNLVAGDTNTLSDIFVVTLP